MCDISLVPEMPTITPEMRRAGAAALQDFAGSYPEEMLAEEVYKAMCVAHHRALRLGGSRGQKDVPLPSTTLAALQ